MRPPALRIMPWLSNALRRAGVALAISAALTLSACSNPAGGAWQPTPRAAQTAPLAPYILSALRSMPVGGGYAADRAAELRLAQHGITWQGSALRISPTGASPTFCSAACYMVLLRALQQWEQNHPPLPREVWHSLRVEPQHADGYLSWGRANANGPGFAKWVRDLGAGYNFTALHHARPGDFLKFFHTPHIGARERGHLVIYLGTTQRAGQTYIRYWSANKPDGYGERTTPLTALHHLIFTRITHPYRLTQAPHLPPRDPWLNSLLTHPTTWPQTLKQIQPTTPND